MSHDRNTPLSDEQFVAHEHFWMRSVMEAWTPLCRVSLTCAVPTNPSGDTEGLVGTAHVSDTRHSGVHASMTLRIQKCSCATNCSSERGVFLSWLIQCKTTLRFRPRRTQQRALPLLISLQRP